jgi:hypothetical protein
MLQMKNDDKQVGMDDFLPNTNAMEGMLLNEFSKMC